MSEKANKPWDDRSDLELEVLTLKAKLEKAETALEKSADKLELFNFAKDHTRVYEADSIIREALKEIRNE